MKCIPSVFLLCVLATLATLSQNNQVYNEGSYCGHKTSRYVRSLSNINRRLTSHLSTCGKIDPAYPGDNLALNKPAYESGAFGGLGAQRAVDGILDNGASENHSLRVCAMTVSDGDGPAQWSVDLLNTYTIYTVTVFNTCMMKGYWRLNNFTVDIVTSDNRIKHNCGYYRQRKPVSRGGYYTFYCNHKQARYVYVSKLESSPGKQHLILCEVVVDGYLINTQTPGMTTSSKPKPKLQAVFVPRGSYLSASVNFSVEPSSDRDLYPESRSQRAIQYRTQRYAAEDIPKACEELRSNVSNMIKNTSWMIDLNDTYSIRTVTVYHIHWKLGSWGMDAFNIYVITSDKTKREVCAVYDEPRLDSDVASYVFKCNNIPGRFVFVKDALVSTDNQTSGICNVIIDGVDDIKKTETPPPLICNKLPSIAYQLGTYHGALADRAIDGQFDVDKTAPDYYLYVCASMNTEHLNREPAKLWLDLGGVYPVASVTVYNTYQQQMSRLLNNFTVELRSVDGRDVKSCGTYSKPEPVSPGGQYTFNCSNQEGQIVFVEKLPGFKEQHRMTLCEVEIRSCTRNDSTTTTSMMTTTTTTQGETTPHQQGGLGVTLATEAELDSKAFQVGTYKGATADKAIDGKFDKDTGDDYYLNVCASISTLSVGNGPAIWWQNIIEPHMIKNVIVYNTYNLENYKRLNQFTVEISLDNKTMHSCGVYDAPDPVYRGGYHLFNCANKQAKWIYVRKLKGSPDQQYMTLCEVVLDAEKHPTIASYRFNLLPTIDQPLMRRPAYQSGTYRGATADKAIDGRLDITFEEIYSLLHIDHDYYLKVCAYIVSFTKDGGPATWWIDLMMYYSVHNVTVFNTDNKEVYRLLNNFTVEIVGFEGKTRQICGLYSKPEPVERGGSYTFNCNDKIGRYVYIRRLSRSEHEELMILCEVLVTGHPVPYQVPADVETDTERPKSKSGSPSITLTAIDQRMLVTCSIALHWIIFGLLVWF